MTTKADQATCPHRGGMFREYLGGFNTGDYACSDCGLAISPQMWAELRRETNAAKSSRNPSLSMTCPFCEQSLLSRYSDFRGVARNDGYCMACGYEVHHLWSSGPQK